MDFEQVIISLYCLFSIVSLTSGEDCLKIDQCSCKTSQGAVDLHPLANDQENPRFTVVGGGYTYDYEPCKELTKPCATKTSGVAVCQRNTDNSYIAGDVDSATFSGVPFGNSRLNLTYTSENGGVLRKSVFHIVCVTTESGKLVSVKEDPPGSGVYLFELQTKYACLSPITPDNNKKHISTGSVLLIIFFVLITVYLVGGILFMKFFAGAQGVELIPNYEFWSSLPGYIKDGCMFTCRGCKTESSYSQI
ncbi:hypothetical protein ACF0H5_018586 [Mactra antiquata]